MRTQIYFNVLDQLRSAPQTTENHAKVYSQPQTPDFFLSIPQISSLQFKCLAFDNEMCTQL